MIDKNKSKLNKSPVVIAEIAVISILLILIAVMLFLCFAFKNNGNTVTIPIMNTKLYFTRSGNMEDKIPKDTLIFAKESAIDDINVKSVILCKIGEDTVLTRVVGLEEEDGKQYYIVRFDTSPENQTFRISENDVVAKALQQTEWFGKVIAFATSTFGIMLIIIVPCFLIILFQIIRIINIKRLEEEASSLDDIDDIIFTRRSDEPSAVKLSKPVFYEDVTDKTPVLGIDKSGKADYSFKNKGTESNPLFTSDMYDRNRRNADQSAIRMPASVSSANTSPIKKQVNQNDDFFVNKPTRIERPQQQKSRVDDFFDTYNPTAAKDFVLSEYKAEPASESSKQNSNSESLTAVFTPFISNVIPDSIVAVQENVSSAASKSSSFDDSVRAYYEKAPDKPVKETAAENITEINTIPEKAVIPKETIAPPVRKKNSRTLDELLSIIDKEETKLKNK